MAPTRLTELDALRGLMLVLMTITHLPTRLSSPLGQPFGYVSAAEGFVLLSAYMAGLVYGRTAENKGIAAMSSAFWRRAFKVYACHLAILLFLFTLIAGLGISLDQGAAKGLMAFYLAEPLRALRAGALLLYKPPLLDILPMYVLFMLASPLLMRWGLRRGWAGVLGLSALLWLLAQFGLGQWLYDATLGQNWSLLAFDETGAFAVFAWQLLWVVGLWMGASRSETAPVSFTPARWLVAGAVAFAVVALLWRHGVGQIPFADGSLANLWFDKWQLGPLRLLNLLALGVIVIRFSPVLLAWKPKWSFLQTLGSASLPVFAAHLVIVLMTLAVWGDAPDARSAWGDALLLAGCFVLLYIVAELTLWGDRQTARLNAERTKRREIRAAMQAIERAAGGKPGRSRLLFRREKGKVIASQRTADGKDAEAPPALSPK